MGYGDWIFLGALLLVCGLGALLGFGKVFCWFVLNKFVRIGLAIFVCYTLGGMILGIPFLNQLIVKDLAANWAHIKFLKVIHLEIIIYYIALFLITLFVIWILSRILRGISESNSKPIRVMNRIGGAILFAAFAFVVMLFVFQIIAWIGGQSNDDFLQVLQQDAPAILRPLYERNPMRSLVNL